MLQHKSSTQQPNHQQAAKLKQQLKGNNGNLPGQKLIKWEPKRKKSKNQWDEELALKKNKQVQQTLSQTNQKKYKNQINKIRDEKEKILTKVHKNHKNISSKHIPH